MALARRFGANEDKARLAGLIHDCAKDMSDDELLDTARGAGLRIAWMQRMTPQLMHGAVGAIVAKRDYGVEDAEVLAAVAHHTMGAERMSKLEKIIYLADMIEPGRHHTGVDEVRALAKTDLDAAVLLTMDKTITYVISRGWILHPDTAIARNDIIRTKREA
ncbi:hypothetical protein SDC9_143443 [bioreactor metagenome]|uniref:HD domain-containing protein n=1 Tax=bioreactor metagenome TaxID=1076179 RepID=A0A645E443_9ZZZZ